MENDDPNRCMGVKRTYQCHRKKLLLPNGEYSNYCYSCGGRKDLKKMKEDKLALYRLTKYNDQVMSFSASEAAKSLGEEVGILRMILQELLNSCEDGDLASKTPQVLLILDRITKLVPAGHKLDTQMGNSFSRASMNIIVDEIIRTISNHIEDKAILDSIADSILATITRVSETSLLEEN